MAGLASPDLRQIWRRSWLASVRELSDDAWQRRLWGRSDNPHHSFDEYLSVYFDDVLLGENYSARMAEGLISEAEVAAVAEFHATIDRYPTNIGAADHDAVLADPAWAEVIAAATHARTNLLALITDPEERRELLRVEPEFP